MITRQPSVSTLNVLGPFGWPKLEQDLPNLPDLAGVYLMTVQHHDGFLPYGVGITRRIMKRRFSEHTRSYTKGDYNILDIDSAKRGIRTVVWKGWGWTPEKRLDYETRRADIVLSAQRQMSGTCIFVIDTGGAARILERLEAAIANHYYAKEEILFDRGMLRMPRWDSEERILAELNCDSKLVGLPSQLEI